MPSKVAAAKNTLWYSDDIGRLYYRDLTDANATWHQAGTPTDRISDFAVLPNGQVYGINKAGQFFTLGSNHQWGAPHAAIKDVDSLVAQPNGDLWIVNFAGRIYKLPAGADLQEGPPPPAGLSTGYWTYKIKPDDRLFEIVRQQYKVAEHQIQPIVDKIVALNRDKLPNQNVPLTVDWELTMPPK